MSPEPNRKQYLTIDELVGLTGLSKSTVWRMKSQGKILFFQPAGKGGTVLFPPDAIERQECQTNAASNERKLIKRLSGPMPPWQSTSDHA